MSQQRVIVRALDRPDTLERVSGLLRRRGFTVERLSSSFVGDNIVELVICLDGAKTDPERVCRELLTLHVVTEIASDSPPSESRELLLARLRTDTASDASSERDSTFEMIGSPQEIDVVLERLRSQDAIIGFVRSGELVMPRASPPHKDQETI
jgi:acetolactate synthase small subunit